MVMLSFSIFFFMTLPKQEASNPFNSVIKLLNPYCSIETDDVVQGERAF